MATSKLEQAFAIVALERLSANMVVGLLWRTPSDVWMPG
jgi:hypothetical protein